MTVFICQNASNCALKVVNFLKCKLYSELILKYVKQIFIKRNLRFDDTLV